MEKNSLIIALDGPSGTGKSSTAKAVAKNLGLLYLNTGAMYRGITYLALQNNIKATNAWAFDLGAACSGFLYGLETGSKFIESGKYKTVMVIGVDTMTSILDFKDRETCIIFGDGAGGVILEASKSDSGIISSILNLSPKIMISVLNFISYTYLSDKN